MCPTILVIHFRFYVIFDAISNIGSIFANESPNGALEPEMIVF